MPHGRLGLVLLGGGDTGKLDQETCKGEGHNGSRVLNGSGESQLLPNTDSADLEVEASTFWSDLPNAHGFLHWGRVHQNASQFQHANYSLQIA